MSDTSVTDVLTLVSSRLKQWREDRDWYGTEAAQKFADELGRPVFWRLFGSQRGVTVGSRCQLGFPA